MFNRLLERYRQDSQEQVQQLIQLYRTHEPSLQLPRESREILDWIGNQGMKTGVITDGYLVVQKNKVKALGLEDLMDFIICTDSLGREHWKPSPRAFEVILEELGCPSESAIYVGDNPIKDFIPGNLLGMVTVQLISQHGVYREASSTQDMSKARHVINSLAELKSLLKSIQGGQK